ncbi:MAG: energy transducer TonB, partial [Bacteroidetes bacterium]|nr:energy transducer TonB [Fibrella sp.]
MAEVLAKDATLDDMVFANRNKAYGAYSLRKEYPGIITRALIIGGIIFTLATLAPTIISILSPVEEDNTAMV